MHEQHLEELPAHYDRVYVLEAAVHTMAVEAELKSGVETGGVLVGFVDSDLNAVLVTAASGPGPNALHTPNTFNRDRAFCQAFLDRHVAATRGVVDFVGEWHKHREPDPQPSPVDVNTYCRLAQDPACHLALPLVLIVGTATRRRKPRVEQYAGVNAFVFRADGFVQRPIRQLPDEAYNDLLVRLSEGSVDADESSSTTPWQRHGRESDAARRRRR